jgi:prepilin-type N-terminal cleavage/methylation domain-containing protein
MRPSPRKNSGFFCSRPRSARKGFTLVELLVVVLILAILMAVALPLYLAALNNSTRRTARANLHTLVNAEQAFRLTESRYTDNPQELITRNVIDKLPVGPGRTEYTLHLGNTTLPDNRTVPEGGVAACANDHTIPNLGDYGCFIPGQDSE